MAPPIPARDRGQLRCPRVRSIALGSGDDAEQPGDKHRSGRGCSASLFALRAWARELPDGVKVFVLSVTVNIGYWAILRSHYVPMTDAEHYWGIGSHLAAGQGLSHVYPSNALHETAFRLPLWPLIEAGALKVFGAHLSVAMGLNAVIGALVAWQAGALARDVAGQRAGRVAGVVVAIYPPLVANDVVCLSRSPSGYSSCW